MLWWPLRLLRRPDPHRISRALPRRPLLAPARQSLAARTWELSCFPRRRQVASVPGEFSGSVTYHDSCTGLRSLGIKAQPRALLALVPGLDVREMPEAEACCGFGGTFAVKFGDISAAIAERKCENVQAAQADAVVGGDLGCLLNIDRLRRMGMRPPAYCTSPEVLAGKNGT